MLIPFVIVLQFRWSLPLRLFLMTIYTQLLTRMQASVCKRCLCRHALSVRLSVYPSVTFVYSVETNKHVFNFCFTIGYPHHSSFSASNVMAIFRLDPTPTPITGTSKKSNAGKVGQARSLGGPLITWVVLFLRFWTLFGVRKLEFPVAV